MSLQYATTTVTCSNEECEAEIDVKVYPGRPAFTAGAPEDCYEAELMRIEPEGCPVCECELPEIEGINELFEDQSEG